MVGGSDGGDMKFLFALLVLGAAGCSTIGQPVNRDCVPEDDRSRAGVWREIQEPERASYLLLLKSPHPEHHRFTWSQAPDGRVSACWLYRYGSSFVVYSSINADARVIDEGQTLYIIE